MKIRIGVILMFISLTSVMAQVKETIAEYLNCEINVLKVTSTQIELELHNKTNKSLKLETFGINENPIKMSFPCYEVLLDEKWENLIIPSCGTGHGVNILEVLPNKKQKIVVDITGLKNWVKLPVTMRVKFIDQVSSQYVISKNFIIENIADSASKDHQSDSQDKNKTSSQAR